MVMYRSCNCEAKEDGRTYVTGNMPVNMNANTNTNMTANMSTSTPQMQDDMDRGGCDMRRKMADDIKSLEFAITELTLYLDTHKDDEKALCLHNRYCKECKDLKDRYQKMYGPLTINYPCNKWRWIEEPWPWERGNF